MKDFGGFVEAFVRNPDGTWLCRTVRHVVGPEGPMTITPGASYRKGQPIQGYDVAGWLDGWNDQRIEPVGVQFL